MKHSPHELLARLCEGKISPEEAISIVNESRKQGDYAPQWSVPLGLALYQAQRHDQALEALNQYRKECELIVDWHIVCGMVARQIPEKEKLAIDCYTRALELDPSRPDIYYNLGNLYKEDEPEKAEPLYRSSIKLDSGSATVWHNLGIALNNQNRFKEALTPLKFSLMLDPFVADVWCNLGLAYFGEDDFLLAEGCFRKSVALDQEHAASHLNLGNALVATFKAEEAIRFLERGVELESSSTNSLFNLSLAYLLCGRYKEGWEYYEARFQSKDFNKAQVPTSGPMIRRFEDLPNKEGPTLVVWSEQGMGDSIQFCRYLSMLDSSDIPYIFMTRTCLLKLQKEWTGLGERVISIDNKDPENDSRPHVSLMSLPLLFGTEIHTVPANVPYLSTTQSTPKNLVIPPSPGGLSVGFVWASNPDNKAMYRNKSMPAELLMPSLVNLAKLDLITIHSLQFGEDADEIGEWRDMPFITEWKDELKDYADTAHVIRQLDLVISVDTAVAHLAGALNRPTWLLLNVNADFRWLRERSDSPWYPSLRLFRQTAHGDWNSVVDQVKDALDVMFLMDLRRLTASSSLT